MRPFTCSQELHEHSVSFLTRFSRSLPSLKYLHRFSFSYSDSVAASLSAGDPSAASGDFLRNCSGSCAILELLKERPRLGWETCHDFKTSSIVICGKTISDSASSAEHEESTVSMFVSLAEKPASENNNKNQRI